MTGTNFQPKLKNQAKKVNLDADLEGRSVRRAERLHSKATNPNPIEPFEYAYDQCEVLDSMHREMSLDQFEMWAAEYEAYQLREGLIFKEPPVVRVAPLIASYSVLQEKYPEVVEEITDWLVFDEVRSQFGGGAFWRSIQPAPEAVMKQFFLKYPQLTKEVSGTWALS